MDAPLRHFNILCRKPSETCYINAMKTMTIRDLRQRWPEAEKALEVESEIIITRDSKPNAKLVRFVPEQDQRPRWDLEEHRQWQEKVFGGNNTLFWNGLVEVDTDAGSLHVFKDDAFDNVTLGGDG